MKILWVCNIALPQIARKLGKPISHGGGWLVGLLNDLKNKDDIELIVCFPLLDESEVLSGVVDNVKFYGVPKCSVDVTVYDKGMEEKFEMIFKNENPDIIHIWGTEFNHTLAAIKVAEQDKTVVSIQGLCSIYTEHYMAALPLRIQKRNTIRDFIKRDNLIRQQKVFEKRGEYEVEALNIAKNVIGRTTWDYVCAKKINPNIKYYFCNETLRDEFYKHKWDYEKCEKNSIFISQATYPIKGLHFLLEAMPDILRRFPDAKIYVAGSDITKNESIKDKIRISSYGKYLMELINKYNLSDKVIYTSSLNEKQMCDRYLKSNVFVCPSSIENSPNSLGEAMLLGVPSVAADVGGIKDMMNDKVEGYIYQGDAPYMLAHYICSIFEDSERSKEMSKHSTLRAQHTHNKKINLETMINIYKDISNNN